MSEIIKERVCAEVDEDLVVFLIGMRINRIWKIWRWWPILRAMPRMLDELRAHPELGMLSARAHFGARNLWMLQYWKSAAHLQSYAHSANHVHLGAWQAFNQTVGSGGDVGIWHETYIVQKGHAESIYVSMPRFGLGLAGNIFAAKGQRATAAKRLTGMQPHDDTRA